VVGTQTYGQKIIIAAFGADLVLIMLVSIALQNATVGLDISLLGGFIVVFVLFAVDFTIKEIAYRNNKIKTAVKGEAVMLIYNGKNKEQNLQHEKITLLELTV